MCSCRRLFSFRQREGRDELLPPGNDMTSRDPGSSVLVTGGAGFIGSAVVRTLIAERPTVVVNVDKLTYAGNLESLHAVVGDPRHRFERVDICDGAELRRIFAEHRPAAVIHLAAESHVDRSIDGPGEFIESNVVGICTTGTSSGPSACSRSPAGTGRVSPTRTGTRSASCMSPPTRSSGRWAPTAASRSSRGTRRARPTPRARPRRIIWSAPGTAPSGCPSSRRTAPTTTARSSCRTS